MPKLIAIRKTTMNGRTLTPGRLLTVTKQKADELIATGDFKILEPGDRRKYGEDYEEEALKAYAEEEEE